MVFGLWQGGKAIRQRLSFDKPVQQQSYTSQELLLLLGAGTCWAATVGFVAWSVTQTSVAIATILHNLAPIFTSLGAWVLFGQGFNRQFLIGMVIAIGGTIAIELDDLKIATTNVPGDLAAIISALFLAAYLLCVEQLRIKFSSSTIGVVGLCDRYPSHLPRTAVRSRFAFPRFGEWVVFRHFLQPHLPSFRARTFDL